jgi:hypothetical protein
MFAGPTSGADLHTITILSGTLGIAINESTHPQYAVQVDYLTGKGDVDQVQTSGVKPRMLIARVNGKSMQGSTATAMCAKASRQGHTKLALQQEWLAGGRALAAQVAKGSV